MSVVVSDNIDRQIAALPVVDRSPPVELAYGLDLWCVLDVTESLIEVDPARPVAVGQAIARRLITPRGGLVDDPNYGLDLRGYVNRGVTQNSMLQLAAQVRAEALKDDRVIDANVIVTGGLRSLTVTLELVLADYLSQTFSLVFFVTSDGIELLGSIDQNG
jgi:hypothetical protein